GFQRLDFRGRRVTALFELLEVLLEPAQFDARFPAHRDPPAQCDAHRPYHVQAGGIAFRDETGPPGLPLGRVGQQLGADQPRQRQVVEEVIHELFARDAKDEVILAGAVLRRTAAARAAAPALGPGNAITTDILAVAGVDRLARPAGSMVEHRLRNITLGQRDVGSFLYVADAAVAHSLAHSVANLLAVAAQEP